MAKNKFSVSDLRAWARLQVRGDLLTRALEREKKDARKLAICSIVNFCAAEPVDGGRDARGSLTDGERRARVEIASRYLAPSVTAYLAEKSVTVGEFVTMYAGADRRAFMRAVLDVAG